MFAYTFSGCSGLTGIGEDFVGIISGSASQDWYRTFYGCSSLTGESAKMTNGQKVYSIYEPESDLRTFDGCTKLDDYIFIPDYWGGPSAGSVKYTVSFDANGGSASMSSQSFTYGVSQALRTNTFSRPGFSFAGWATSSTGGVVYSNGQSVSNLTSVYNGTVTLYAVWTANPLYTISFDEEGGSTVADITQNGGTSVANPNYAPTRTGYTFGGWYTGDDGTGSNFPWPHTLMSNVTVYAKWNLNAPAAPSSPQLSAGNKQITVAWLAVDFTTAYEVWIGTNSSISSASKYGSDIIGTTSTIITGLTDGTTYYIWINAKNSAGTSAFSPSSNVTLGINSSINISLAKGSDVTLSSASESVTRGNATTVTVSGSYNVYQWYLDGEPITGAVSSSCTLETDGLMLGVYELSVTATASDGVYSGRCMVSVQ
jgi:uncharacterized repeat protein (TIGR02543 family)